METLIVHSEMMGYLPMETHAPLHVMMVMGEMVLKKENVDKCCGVAEMSFVLKVGLGNTINCEYRQTNVCNINITCIYLLQYYRKGNIYLIVQY